MVWPLVAAYGLSAAAGLFTAARYKRYADRLSNYQQEFYGNYAAENVRYWDRYRRLHHIQHRPVRYPYRTGYNYDLSRLQNAGLRKVSAQNSVWNSGARAVGIFGFYRAPIGYRATPNYTDIMFR